MIILSLTLIRTMSYKKKSKKGARPSISTRISSESEFEFHSDDSELEYYKSLLAGPGRCFGEIALISEENARNASIISDEDSDFLVIHRDLYNQTLKVCNSSHNMSF